MVYNIEDIVYFIDTIYNMKYIAYTTYKSINI